MSSTNDQQSVAPTLPYRALTQPQQRLVTKLATPGMKLVLTRLSFTNAYWRADHMVAGARVTVEKVATPTAEKLRETGWIVPESKEYRHSTYYVYVYVLNPLAVLPEVSA